MYVIGWGEVRHTCERRQDVGWVGCTLNEALGQLGQIGRIYVAGSGYRAEADILG